MFNEFQTSNAILSGLTPQDLTSLIPKLTMVTLSLHQTLLEAEQPITNVFFLESGLVSHTANTGDEGQVEVGLTGKEGFIGATIALNSQAVALHRGFMQAPGFAYEMDVSTFLAELDRLPGLRNRTFRYIHFLLGQSAQVAACNGRHNLSMRLARWLLMARDRLDTDALPMTQEFLSLMLGVRRAGVNIALGELVEAKLIKTGRRSLKILDRVGLMSASCDCYQILRKTYRAILGNDGGI